MTAVIWRLDWRWRMYFSSTLLTWLANPYWQLPEGLNSYPHGLLLRAAQCPHNTMDGMPQSELSKRPRWMLQYHCHSILSVTQVSHYSQWEYTKIQTVRIIGAHLRISLPHCINIFPPRFLVITARQAKDLGVTVDDISLIITLPHSVYRLALWFSLSNMFWTHCFINSTATA